MISLLRINATHTGHNIELHCEALGSKVQIMLTLRAHVWDLIFMECTSIICHSKGDSPYMNQIKVNRSKMKMHRAQILLSSRFGDMAFGATNWPITSRATTPLTST